MKFFVNFLSAFRIAASFAIIPTLLLQWFWVSLILFVLGALSDFFDGYLARKYDVCTKIGGVIDHIGDKLIVVNTLMILMIILSWALLSIGRFGSLWVIIVPVIVMVARELYISGLREFLGTQKIEMPVPKARFSMGKIKTTLQMISITALLLYFALGTSSFMMSYKYYEVIIAILSQIGIIGLWASLLASVWSATQYTFTFIEKLKKVKNK